MNAKSGDRSPWKSKNIPTANETPREDRLILAPAKRGRRITLDSVRARHYDRLPRRCSGADRRHSPNGQRRRSVGPSRLSGGNRLHDRRRGRQGLADAVSIDLLQAGTISWRPHRLVSHYVTPGSPRDREATAAAPRLLCRPDGAHASRRPVERHLLFESKVDRLTLSSIMELTKRPTLSLYPAQSVIRSCERLVYST
jgi:hypothetical protein